MAILEWEQILEAKCCSLVNALNPNSPENEFTREVITSAFYIHKSKMAETVLPFLTNQYTTITRLQKPFLDVT